uniref:Uncharacterized protein n=1 Tax=Oryza barthii TaxID=65489 RepID=A0A0D3FUE0_9ORYZ
MASSMGAPRLVPTLPGFSPSHVGLSMVKMVTLRPSTVKPRSGTTVVHLSLLSGDTIAPGKASNYEPSVWGTSLSTIGNNHFRHGCMYSKESYVFCYNLILFLFMRINNVYYQPKPCILQRSEEWMRQKADKLKENARTLFWSSVLEF